MCAMRINQSDKGYVNQAIINHYAKRFQDEGVDALEVLAGTWKKEASMEDMPDSIAEAVSQGYYCGLNI